MNLPNFYRSGAFCGLFSKHFINCGSAKTLMLLNQEISDELLALKSFVHLRAFSFSWKISNNLREFDFPTKKKLFEHLKFHTISRTLPLTEGAGTSKKKMNAQSAVVYQHWPRYIARSQNNEYFHSWGEKDSFSSVRAIRVPVEHSRLTLWIFVKTAKTDPRSPKVYQWFREKGHCGLATSRLCVCAPLCGLQRFLASI